MESAKDNKVHFPAANGSRLRSCGLEVALEPTREQALDDLPRARVAGTSRIVSAALLLVASRACERQVARILGPAGERPQPPRVGCFHPTARYHVLQRRR